MRLSLLLSAAPLGALASLNCTLTAPMDLRCCPDSESELVNTFQPGRMVMLGCAADDQSAGLWFWNYNSFYTENTTEVENCVLDEMEFPAMDILPICSEDTFVLELTNGSTSPLDPCDPMCVTNENWPEQTYFGDTWEDL